MPAGAAQWEERHIDDSKAQQGWRLQTSSLGEISAESLYRTGLKTDKNRHTTARYATVDDGEYKTGNEKASQAKVGRAGAGVGGKARSSSSSHDIAALRRKQREARERDNDHLSDLMAKRLQSIEVRQAGLDEDAFARHFNRREVEASDEELARQLLAEEEGANEERQRRTLAAEQADAELARALLLEDERAQQEALRQVASAEEADGEYARKLLAEEEKRVALQRQLGAEADMDHARKMMAEEEKRTVALRQSGAEADLEFARVLQAEEERRRSGGRPPGAEELVTGSMTIMEAMQQQGGSSSEPFLLLAAGQGGSAASASMQPASTAAACSGVSSEPLPGLLSAPHSGSAAGCSRPSSSAGRRPSRTGSRATLPVSPSSSAFQRIGSSIAGGPGASPTSPGPSGGGRRRR